MHEFQLRNLAEETAISVFPGVLQQDDGYYVSFLDSLPFEVFIDQFPEPQRQSASRPARPEPDALLHRHKDLPPWMAQHLAKKALGVKRDHRGEAKKLSFHEEHTQEELDEEVIAQVHAELDKLRETWQKVHGEDEAAWVHFRLEHRGGEWTQQHIGVSSDICRGVPCTTIGEKLLQMWKLPMQFGNTYSKYSLAVAELLSKSWCHRMAYFAELWSKAGCSHTFEFTEAHTRDYVETEELLLASAAWDPRGQAAVRLGQLRLIRPLGLPTE